MPVANDPAPALQAYAHPEKLVTTEWLAANLGDPKIGPAATAMLLHEGLLDRDGETATVTLREKSDRLLERAGFTWSPVRPEQIWSLTK